MTRRPSAARTTTLVSAALLMAVTTPAGAEARPLERQVSSALAQLERTAEVQQVIASEDGHSLRLIAGRLSRPSSARPERVARRFFEERWALFGLAVDLCRLEVSPVLGQGDLRVVRFQQRLGGVEVLGARAAVLIDGDGRVRLVAQSLAPLLSVPAEPVVAPVEATEIALAAGLAPAASFEPSDRPGRLVYARTDRGLAPAYEVSLGRIPGLLANWHVLIDGETGEVLGRTNRVFAERTALALLDDPGVAVPEAVTLETLELTEQACVDEANLPASGPDGEVVPGASTPRLCTSRLSVLNCFDYEQTITADLPGLGERVLHSCTPYHIALPNDAPETIESPDDDLDNDFFYEDLPPPEGYRYSSDPAAGEDLFAEVNVFYHLEAGLEDFRAVSPEVVEALDASGLEASVNWRLPFNLLPEIPYQEVDLEGSLELGSVPTGTLYPFLGAYYVPADGAMMDLFERPRPSILFFQAEDHDPAHDPDVIAHELAHALIDAAIGADGLGAIHRDELGVHRLSRALIEGYADFFAATRSGDPVHAASSTVPRDDIWGSELRDLGARPRAQCPGWVINEPHHDSLPLSQALWEIRQELGGSPEAIEQVDQAVMLGLFTLPPDAGLQDAAAATVTTLEVELGSEAAQQAREVFELYGYSDDTACQRVIALRENEMLPRLIVDGRETAGDVVLSPFVPAVVQLRFELDRIVGGLVVSYQQRESIFVEEMFALPERPNLALLVRSGDDPVAFTTEGPVGAEADGFVTEASADGSTLSQRLFYYDPDGERLQAGTYHLALVNMGRGRAALEEIAVRTLSELPMPPPSEDTVDYDDLEPYEFSSTCDCAQAGRSSSQPSLWARLFFL